MTNEQYTELKISINSMMLQYLPAYITIGQSSDLSMCVYYIITDPMNYLKEGVK